MSEIQSVADVEHIKYIIGGFGILFSLINALIVYIFRNAKKDIEEIKKKQDKDHDRLNQIGAEHDIYHPKPGNNQDKQ